MALFEIATFQTLTGLLLAARKLGTDPDPLNRAKALADLAQNGAKLSRVLRGADLTALAAEMKEQAEQADRAFAHDGPNKDDARLIFWQVAPVALADDGVFASGDLTAGPVVEAMITAIHDSGHKTDFSRTGLAAPYFRAVMTPALAKMLDSAGFVDSIRPALWRRLLTDSGVQIERLTAIQEDTAQTREITDEILSLVKELRETKATTVPQATLIAIARKTRPRVANRDEALAELDRAADIAADLEARGAAGSNVDALVDAVLKELAALSREGRLSDAASLAQDKLAAAKAGVAQLREAAIDTLLLDQQPVPAAALIAERLAEDTTPPDLFAALLAEAFQWRERGQTNGARLDLEVGLALAELTVQQAADADQRGAAWNGLGTAHTILARRTAEPEHFVGAVQAYETALADWTRDRVPLDWAATQNNLGNALASFGSRAGDAECLGFAVEAFEAALTERTRALAPLDWAATQHNLGTALDTRSAISGDIEDLARAEEAFEAALTEWTRDRVPLDWAMTQNNLGSALRNWGTRLSDQALLARAAKAFENALLEWTRERVPMDWATAQNNLGNALASLAEQTGDADTLTRAEQAYEAALEEHTRTRAPLDWAMAQNNLGNALETLGAQTGDVGALDRAVTAFEAALLEWTPDRAPVEWAVTQINLANLSRSRFDLTEDPAALDAAQGYLALAIGMLNETGAEGYLPVAANVQAGIDSRRAALSE